MKKWKKRIGLIVIAVAMVLCLCGCSAEREEKQEILRQEGIAYLEQGEYEKAVEVFQEALDLSLGEVGEIEIDICFYKAEALYMLGDAEGAIATYSAIIDYNQDSRAYFLRGNLYYSQGKADKAMPDYEAAVKNAKDNYEVYIGIYEVLASYNRMEEADQCLEAALKIRGSSAYDNMQKGRIHYLLGKKTEALELLTDAIDRKETDAYFYLGEIYIKEGLYQEAVSALETVLAQEEIPHKQMAMKYLVQAYEFTGDFESAKNLMAMYIKAYPEDEEAARENIFLETR